MYIRVIGIDLAVKGKHAAAIFDPATHTLIATRLHFRTRPKEMDRILQRARKNAPSDLHLVVMLEATGMSWFPVGLFFHRHGATVYRINGRATKAQRKVSWPHARSDRLDSITLATMYTSLPPQQLTPWTPPSADLMALQRMARELQRLVSWQTGITLRLQSIDQWAWGGWYKLIPATYREWVRRSFYDPWTVTAYGTDILVQRLQQTYPDAQVDWIPNWVARAKTMQALYEKPETVGYDHLAALAKRELDRLQWLSQERTSLVEEHFLPLYRRLFPQDILLSFRGIAERSAAIYHAFIGDITRFHNSKAFARWTGMVPRSDQSGDGRSPRMRLSKQGPNLIKATLYQNAEVARQWDVQLAKIYYTQMVEHGKHHTQAVCAVASHLARRIYTALREGRPYELRGLDGRPISKKDSRDLILSKFQVPESLRQQRRKHRQG